jgi:hypothetical protein
MRNEQQIVGRARLSCRLPAANDRRVTVAARTLNDRDSRPTISRTGYRNRVIVGRARLSCRLPAARVVARLQRRAPQTTGMRALQKSSAFRIPHSGLST